MKNVVLISLFCLLVTAAIICVGCNKPLQKKTDYKPKDVKEFIESEKFAATVKNLSWVQGVLVIGAVASVFACFMGAAKFGAPALASCLIGYGLVSAGIYYGKWIALIGFLGGVGVCCWAIWRNRRAFREVVAGGERLKLRSNTTTSFRDAHNEVQSKSTRKLVSKLKGKLK